EDRHIERRQILADLLLLSLHALRQGPKGGKSLLDNRAQIVCVHVVGEGEGEVEWIRRDSRVAETGVAQHNQLAPTLCCDGIDRARREAPRARLLDGLNQPFSLQSVESRVQRANLDIAPELSALKLGLAADLVPMGGAVAGEHAEHKELRCAHLSTPG